MKKKTFNFIFIIVLACLILTGCRIEKPTFENTLSEEITLNEIPEFNGSPYVCINNNEPEFEDSDLTEESFEIYGELDPLGRCTTAFANIGIDLMPTEERGSIGNVRPSGWQMAKYDIIDGKYLYNRCHLIGFQLAGENANKNNLITGTRYLNIEGMLPFENMVADYIKETENHVLYRVTPIFEGNNLVASGVQIEALSVEDLGKGISFNVYAYNAQPGIEIDYLTGESFLLDLSPKDDIYFEHENYFEYENTNENLNIFSYEETYILNTKTSKFHYPDCSSIDSISSENKDEFTGNRNILIDQGYSPCGKCNP